MKKRKLAAGIAAAALVAVLSISAVYAGNQGKSVSALWGEILKQSADEEKINTQTTFVLQFCPPYLYYFIKTCSDKSDSV